MYHLGGGSYCIWKNRLVQHLMSTLVSTEQCKSMVHNVALYCCSGAQCRIHKPSARSLSVSVNSSCIDRLQVSSRFFFNFLIEAWKTALAFCEHLLFANYCQAWIVQVISFQGKVPESSGPVLNFCMQLRFFLSASFCQKHIPKKTWSSM